MNNIQTFGVAIPTYAKHLQYLDRLLETISMSSALPDHVVVSCSGLESIRISAEKYDYPLTIISTSKYQNPARNRNIAARLCGTDVISFIDGDDLVHPMRTEILKNIFLHGRKIVCHDYFRVDVNFDLRSIAPLSAPEIWFDYVDSISSNALFPINSKRHLPYHAAHITILRDIFESHCYNEDEGFKYREDSEFLRRLVLNGYKIDYCPSRLSYYRK
jgi:hypothetical protein